MFCEFVAPINDNKGILFSKNEKIITNFKETATINNKTIPGNSKANISSDVFEQICHHEERFAFDKRHWKIRIILTPFLAKRHQKLEIKSN